MDGHGGQVSVRPAPDPLQQLLSGESDARVPHEERQQIVFSRAWQERAGRRRPGNTWLSWMLVEGDRLGRADEGCHYLPSSTPASPAVGHGPRSYAVARWMLVSACYMLKRASPTGTSNRTGWSRVTTRPTPGCSTQSPDQRECSGGCWADLPARADARLKPSPSRVFPPNLVVSPVGFRSVAVAEVGGEVRDVELKLDEARTGTPETAR